MIIVSIANQKGGEGKTTTSLNLAWGLARRGKRTLLIDIDPQANSTGIFLNPEAIEKSMYNIFQTKAKVKDIMVPTHVNNLIIAPSRLTLAEAETAAANVEAPYILRDAIMDLEKDFDFCVIDCPPSLSIFTINALVASNYVIIPLQAEKFSVDGILGLQQTISSIKKRINPSLEILGALVTQLKPQTLLTKTIVPVLTKYFRIFENSISDGVAVGESHLAKKSVYDYNKSSRQAQEYEGFIEEFLHELQK
ncbi:chromosome partitioning protein ParA [Leptospira perolatii]|uniref:Chromosome partitioning protein ParA n=1 Tax=Leptospira perolatii TaxID=2023191 RepID=A0A2M9ZPH7_9LEPT|nr:ParA family protein [Leptospira perolatii]PJZ70758.1 chromosome partitioning protein ParA [Leptospira perolatii]PJZ73966.1 chromosome partitioning protein ParA [Leptospira perolatii]